MIDPALFTENERTAAVTDARRYCSVDPFRTEGGAEIRDVRIAYETWGALNAAKDNAVMVFHAVSGDSHAIGWWDRLVGPQKLIDTEKYFVVCSNVLGGCQGSTGPGSLDADGNRLGSRFPQITIGDMVDAQRGLLDHLGIEKLHLVMGGSMGGMQALEWSLRYPERVANTWLTATASQHSAMQIAFNEAARQAILRDPKWLGGDFSTDDPPFHGLSVARMIGHLSYLSDYALTEKFGRTRQPDRRTGEEVFAVESYLGYQGDKFNARFDAGSFITLTRAIDLYEASGFERAQSRYLITSFASDWLYPTSQSAAIENALREANKSCQRFELGARSGHDSFLLDDSEQAALVRGFLG